MFIIFLLLSVLRANALPTPSSFGPNTLPFAAHWLIFGRATSDDPHSDDRTLVDIVRSCVLTVAACVYRAIHPNVPDPKAGPCKVQYERLKVTIYALLAPEMVIFWAIRQRMGARLIVRNVNKAFEKKNIGIRWTMAHGHFTQMGGFCREDNEHVIFTPALIELIEQDRVNIKGLRLTEKDINDRSKGDYLSKGFITLQTTWFILECITRLVTHLPLTELEVITLGYATLNIATFMFWFDKPLNVNRPNYLEIYNHAYVQTGVELAGEISEEKRVDGVGSITVAATNITDTDPPAVSGKIVVNVSSWNEVTSGLHWGMDDPLIGVLFPRIRNLLHLSQDPQKDRPKRFLPRVLLTVFESLLKRPFCHIFAPPLDLVDDSTTPRGAKHVSSYYAMQIRTDRWWVMWYPSCFIAIVFGVIHFLAWNSHFPTQTEQTLWRVCTIILVLVPFDLLVMGVAFDTHDRWGKKMGKRTRIALQVFCCVLAIFSMAFGLMIYALARVCLTVQAAIALRALPPGVFTGIVWTSFIPHF